MSETFHVVQGEASESDSELEIGRSPESTITLSPDKKTSVLPGEAPESDDETKLKPMQCLQDPDTIQSEPSTPSPSSPMRLVHSSLLHQKLCYFVLMVIGSNMVLWNTGECNVRLRATVEGLLKHTVEIAVDKLTRADRTLLNVQESMRATSANLTLSRARLKQMQTELERANCAAALPTVKIN